MKLSVKFLKDPNDWASKSPQNLRGAGLPKLSQQYHMGGVSYHMEVFLFRPVFTYICSCCGSDGKTIFLRFV